ncbi:MAG: hypothetical protein HC895_11570 [Leptolyngbyaceae cyanobacterium SM1_3_5]|nr:hypothetical protein [Leptolyngbyaceae cyanobacterium SM1_3_5]
MTTNPPGNGDRLDLLLDQSIANLLQARNDVLEAICAFDRAYDTVEGTWLQLQAVRSQIAAQRDR